MTGPFRAVVYFLGAALILCVVGVVVLAMTGNALPDLLKEIGVGALAGLTGLLVHPSGDPAPVSVVNGPQNPVPVDPGPPSL